MCNWRSKAQELDGVLIVGRSGADHAFKKDTLEFNAIPLKPSQMPTVEDVLKIYQVRGR